MTHVIESPSRWQLKYSTTLSIHACPWNQHDLLKGGTESSANLDPTVPRKRNNKSHCTPNPTAPETQIPLMGWIEMYLKIYWLLWKRFEFIAYFIKVIELHWKPNAFNWKSIDFYWKFINVNWKSFKFIFFPSINWFSFKYYWFLMKCSWFSLWF